MKPISILITLHLILNCCEAMAQDTITVYYDTNWVVVKYKSEASFYRKAFRDSNSYWKVYDYYMNNKIQMTGTFTTSGFTTKNGQFAYYHLNGQKQSEGNILKNKKVGYWYEWYDSGKKQSEGKFVNDKRDSIWNYYDNEGKIRHVEKFISGKLTYMTSYFSNGNLWCKGPYVHDMRDGEWLFWNVDGRLYMRGFYNKGKAYGEWFRYFTNGETMKLVYRNGAVINRSPGGIFKQLDSN